MNIVNINTEPKLAIWVTYKVNVPIIGIWYLVVIHFIGLERSEQKKMCAVCINDVGNTMLFSVTTSKLHKYYCQNVPKQK